MRKFINAYQAFLDEQQEAREQNRILAYFSWVSHGIGRHRIKISDLYPLPGDVVKSKASQKDKTEVYKKLKQWDK